jgi:hypothetical protein
LLENFVTLMKDDSIATFVPENVLNLIKTFSSTLKDAMKTVKIIHNAKYKAEQELQTKIVFEELPLYGVNTNELYNTLLKAYQKQKTETVNSIDNLIFTYVKNWFIEKAGQAVLQANQQQSKSGPKIPMHDWSESF